MNRPELLSPAGNLTKLKIALNYGADAVYASVGSFSLRTRSAKEFDLQSFEEGVKFTHARGKKFYATINAFPFNGQLESIKRHLTYLKDIGVDALIIATPGVMALAKSIAPNVEIHISTQANVMNYLDAQIYHDLGACRIVASREMSLKDAVLIKEKIPNLQIEIFVHGSMCFAYSGRCLISALQSGRLSNRGSCANDCRFGYELYAKNEEKGALFKINEDEGSTMIMNAKDLCLINHIQNIISTGAIDSFKIEGRTKSEYYAGCATNAYKMAIDDVMSDKFKPLIYENELLTLKSRGFSDGYLIHKPYERNDTQNLNSSLEEGTHQVHAMSEDGEFFRCKGLVKVGVEYEIFAPKDTRILPCDNEIGEIFEKDGKMMVKFRTLTSKTGKIYGEIHSGNESQIKLPQILPQFSFLRKEI